MNFLIDACIAAYYEIADFKVAAQLLNVNIRAEVKMKAIEYLKGNIELEYENGDFIMNLHLLENEELCFETLFSLGNLVKVIETEA